MPPEPSIKTPRWCWFAILLLCLCKLILTSNDEIMAVPDDDYGYCFGASVLHWGVPYGTWAFARQPVYHFYLAAAELFGLPVRLWIEFTWMGATITMLLALRRLGFSPLAALITFTIALFHPWTLMLFNRTLCDSLFGALMLVYLSSLAVAITRTDRAPMSHWGRRAAIFGALAANTRFENPPILGVLGISALCILGLHRFAKADRRLTIQRGLWCVALPLAVIFGLTHAIKLRNYTHIGAYVTTDLELPGFKKLYKSLLSIRPAAPNLRTAIPRDARDWAYNHSPTFAQLRYNLEVDDGRIPFQRDTEYATGIAGEYGTWTVWGIRSAVWKLRQWPSARELDAFYNQAGEEIFAALKAEPAKARWSPIPFIPPDWGPLMTNFPSAISKWANLLLQAAYWRAPDQKLEDYDIARINSVTNRRQTLLDINNRKAFGPSFWHRKESIQRLDRWKQSISSLNRPLTLAAAILTGLGTLIGLIGIRRRLFPASWCVLSAILWTAIAARLTIFALLYEITGDPVLQHRYMFPLVAPIFILGVLNAQAILRLAISFLRNRLKRSATDQAALR